MLVLEKIILTKTYYSIKDKKKYAYSLHIANYLIKVKFPLNDSFSFNFTRYQ
jgi:hypothetical protein